MKKIMLAFVALATLALAACNTPAPAAPAPTTAPTVAVAAATTAAPTAPDPTAAPTAAPTLAPTSAPTLAPTSAPTLAPTQAPAPTAAPTEPPTEAPAAAAAAAGDASAQLDAVMAAAKDVKALRSTQVSDTGGAKTTTVVEYIAPDRYHLKNPRQEVIMIGDKVYLNNNGKWKENATMSSIFKPIMEGFRNLSPLRTNVQSAGTDNVDGVPTHVFTYDSSMSLGDVKVDSQVKVWVRDSDQLPVKQEINGDVSGTKTHTVVTIEYPQDIQIEVPQ